jgi:hypothetical protein
LFHKVPEEKREFVLSLIRAAIDNLWLFFWLVLLYHRLSILVIFHHSFYFS